MLMPRDEGFDASLVRDAQSEAAQWGADRFAAEFERREEEERRLRDAEAGIFFRYPGVTYPGDEPRPEMLSGPVDQSVGHRVVEAVAAEAVEIRKPTPIRHAYVPRPPRADEGRPRRRGRRGRRDDRAASMGPRIPSQVELASMSAAGRRLYGFDDDPSKDRGHTKN
jgi:hypothetical protein